MCVWLRVCVYVHMWVLQIIFILALTKNPNKNENERYACDKAIHAVDKYWMCFFFYAAVVGLLLVACLVVTVCGSQRRNFNENNKASRRFTHGHNGRPGCRMQAEFERKWRNNNDPLRYWRCHPVSRLAVSFVCPTEFMYQDKRQCCVHWSRWIWTRPFDPPTLG